MTSDIPEQQELAYQAYKLGREYYAEGHDYHACPFNDQNLRMFWEDGWYNRSFAFNMVNNPFLSESAITEFKDKFWKTEGF